MQEANTQTTKLSYSYINALLPDIVSNFRQVRGAPHLCGCLSGLPGEQVTNGRVAYTHIKYLKPCKHYLLKGAKSKHTAIEKNWHKLVPAKELEVATPCWWDASGAAGRMPGQECQL